MKTLISRCAVRRSEVNEFSEFIATDGLCSGRLFNSGLEGGCGEPCSFVMRKRGSGVPDFLDVEDALCQIVHVLRIRPYSKTVRKEVDIILRRIHRGGYSL